MKLLEDKSDKEAKAEKLITEMGGLSEFLKVRSHCDSITRL